MAYVPNALIPAKGEKPLFDKISVHIELAEYWAENTFVSSEAFGVVAELPRHMQAVIARLVVTEALRTAIPSLDLVVTPNGFAVTQTANLTPASKQRVDRLVESMLALRDESIMRLLPLLPAVSCWLDTGPAAFFGATLFPDLAVTRQIGNYEGSKWDKYLELRPQIMELEAALAEDYVSPELLNVLRRRRLRQELLPVDRPVIDWLRAQIVSVLRGGSVNERRMTDCVNYIRLRPEAFPQWHNSATAELYCPPVFTNRKEAAGYFF